MYEKQNSKIEKSVDALVRSYESHEQKTYDQLKPENATLFAAQYPELQSNSLAQKELDLYVQNNAKIVSLKNKSIELTSERWWLYFGK